MLLAELVATSQSVAAVSGRLAKIEHLADLLNRVARDEVDIAIAFLAGATRQGRIGLGWSTISAAQSLPADTPTLTLHDADDAFSRIAATSGAGSMLARSAVLRGVFARATAGEQDFLVRLLMGELRQGALEGVLVEAVARAAGIRADLVRRAVMLAGEIAPVAHAALLEGEQALDRFAVELMRPVQPMLADTADDVGEALDRVGEAALEWKLDGARIQVHKAGDEVKVFSRHLREVTQAVPEVVAVVKDMPARELILDGEVIALRGDGSPHAFQTTMRRFGRKQDVEGLRTELPLSSFFFDLLLADGAVLIDEPQSRRFDMLRDAAGAQVVPSLVTAGREAADAFLAEAVARGHEGVMAKARDAAYAAGRRGQAWLKIKRTETLDLVVLAAEWGHGRRRGWLSNLHLGARDPERGAFVMLGKTFKGLTDALLEWQTKELVAREIGRDGITGHVRPELVVEVAFNDVQESPQYPGGLALRFARVKRYRTDKTAETADTLARVQQVFQRTTGKTPPPRR